MATDKIGGSFWIVERVAKAKAVVARLRLPPLHLIKYIKFSKKV